MIDMTVLRRRGIARPWADAARFDGDLLMRNLGRGEIKGVACEMVLWQKCAPSSSAKHTINEAIISSLGAAFLLLRRREIGPEITQFAARE